MGIRSILVYSIGLIITIFPIYSLYKKRKNIIKWWNTVLVGEHYYFDRNHENELDSGAFGVVFKGYDKRNGNVIAVKEINEAILNMSSVERENEIIMLLKSINHENIVIHYHTDRKDGFIFMVMEFCNYNDLESYYNNHAPLNMSDMNIILKQLANGLQLLYSNRIIHRDLKPMNILLHNNKNLEDPLINDLTLKIADFGTSRFISNNTLATTSVGTPIYMAPELYTQEKYDHKADVWSVGLIVYKGLYGRLPKILNRDNFTFNFWNVLHNRNEEPKIEFPFCESLKLIKLLRKLLIRDVASRMHMLSFLNLILTEEPGNNRNVIIVKRLDKKALISDPRLLSAAQGNNIDLVRTLLEQCADPNIKDDHGSTALHLSVENKNDNKIIIELLLKNGADIDSQDEDGETCLMTAAFNNNIEIVRCLLQNGADINRKNSGSDNVLHYAARNENDNKSIIELLLKNGADIDSQDEYGFTCLMKAAINNNIEIVHCLLQNGADINRKNHAGSNVLLYAAESRNDNKIILELLLEYGADIDSQDQDGNTCLMKAAINNNIEIVRYFLQNGADINRKNHAGSNVLLYAAVNKNDNKFIIELLLEYGADIDSQNEIGDTCLMWAAINNKLKIVRCLLQNGADINKQNRFGENAIKRARSNKKDNKEMVELLLDYEREKSKTFLKKKKRKSKSCH